MRAHAVFMVNQAGPFTCHVVPCQTVCIMPLIHQANFNVTIFLQRSCYVSRFYLPALLIN
ncbi:hypothetical protein STW0522KLE44_P40110 (plasmid) [Klebsiella sp. STW0522-44]|nr:hypothetical protein STW0522KLE44_P40110 [Klebsiella sp. STW0522-44]